MGKVGTSEHKPANRPAWHIAVISFFILTLELALIRQVPAEVRVISYFTNLLLMATFFGLGLGCILQKWRSLYWLTPLGLCLLALFILYARGIVIYSEAKSVHFWLQYGNLPKTAPRLPLFFSVLSVFLLGGITFVGIGQALARAMDQYPRLVAYSWDLAGSITGTVAFAVGSYFGMPPWLWVPIGALMWGLVQVRNWPARTIHIAAGALFLVFVSSDEPSRWSPYYYIQYVRGGEGIRVWVNSSFHQLGVDLTTDDPQYADMPAAVIKKFSRPYDVYRQYHQGIAPKKVLILGAGTGNDVNIALHNGAEQITAVEIDPVILELGEEFNTSHPYQEDRVELVVDDARHFLWNTEKRFDLVVFGTLDSQTLLSAHANLRLENYVYTRESFEDVKRVLAPEGMFAAYYSVFKPWLVGRILATARPAFGDSIKAWLSGSNYLFNAVVMGANGVTGFSLSERQAQIADAEIPATDNWPFLYLKKPTISPVYRKLSVVLLVLITGAFIVVRSQHRVAGLHTNFLLFGLGFTLMESAAVVRLALLFGATWVTNALVFFSVLVTIFLANLLTLKGRAPSLRAAWIGLLALVLVNYLAPLQIFFALDIVPRVGLLIVFIGLPVFFAAVCFSRLFAVQKMTGAALGMNLVGAMGGGLLEYLSMALGMRAIWLIALGVYFAAYLATVSKPGLATRSPLAA